MLETLGRLTSEEMREWEEPEHKEVELIEREGAGDGGREDTLEGTSGSAAEKESRVERRGEREGEWWEGGGGERSGYREESESE